MALPGLTLFPFGCCSASSREVIKRCGSLRRFKLRDKCRAVDRFSAADMGVDNTKGGWIAVQLYFALWADACLKASEEATETVGGESRHGHGFSAAALGKKVGVDLLLVIIRFRQGKDGFFQIQGFADQLVAGGGHQGTAGGQIGDEPFKIDIEKVEIGSSGLFAETVDTDLMAAFGQCLQDIGGGSSPQVGNNMVALFELGAEDLRAEEDADARDSGHLLFQGREVEG